MGSIRYRYGLRKVAFGRWSSAQNFRCYLVIMTKYGVISLILMAEKIFKVNRASISCEGSLVTSARVTLRTHKTRARVKKQNKHGKNVLINLYKRQ